MAKVKGPLLSLSASGQIGKSQVYARWRGVPYVRQHVVPGNPKTTAQTLTRNVFSSLDSIAKRLGPLSRAPWLASVIGRPLTNRNAGIKTNLSAIRAQPNMQLWQGSPGAAAGLPPSNVVAIATATPGEISITITSPQEPTGWTLAAAVAHAFIDRAPDVQPVDFPIELENAAPTAGGDTIVLLTGATSAVLYVVSGWLRWTRPDGKTAYGAALTTTATPL